MVSGISNNSISGSYQNPFPSFPFKEDLIAINECIQNPQTVNATGIIFDSLMDLKSIASATPDMPSVMSNIILNAANLYPLSLTDSVPIYVPSNTSLPVNTLTIPSAFTTQILIALCNYGASYYQQEMGSNPFTVSPLPLPTSAPSLPVSLNIALQNLVSPSYQNCDSPLPVNFNTTILTLIQTTLAMTPTDFLSFINTNFQTPPYPGSITSDNNFNPGWRTSGLGYIIGLYNSYNTPNSVPLTTTDLENINSVLLNVAPEYFPAGPKVDQ